MLGRQVVDQHANVGLIAAQDQRRLALDIARGIDPGDQALGGGLLVPRRAIDLPAVVQALDPLGRQRAVELSTGDRIVFDRITGAHDLCIAQGRDGAQRSDLDRFRHAGKEPLHIDLTGLPSFRLEEKGVPLLVGKTDQLFFKGGAVTWSSGLDRAWRDLRTIQVIADHLMGVRVGVDAIAGNLWAPRRLPGDGVDRIGRLLEIVRVRQIRIRSGVRRQKTEIQRLSAARLYGRLGKVDRAGVDARRRVGLQLGQVIAQPLERLGEGIGRELTGSPCREALRAAHNLSG